MKNLRTRFNRFCLRNRDKGIPNLMLYLTLGSAVVYVLSMMAGNSVLYNFLRFDRSLILQGQVWRLFTYPLTYGVGNSNLLLVAISLFCYYSLARAIESIWGTLRFNLFYFTGMLLMDVFAMCLGGILVRDGAYAYDFSALYTNMGYYLNLSLFLSYATLFPDARFLLFFIIPVKAWIFALLDLALTLYEVITLSTPLFCFPHNLFPLVALANYFLFFGKDVVNVFPLSWRLKLSRRLRKKSAKAQEPKIIHFETAGPYRPAPKKEDFLHKCTVCGRTDTDNPDLEFRYCSRCRGYHCYCIDHINDHQHIEE